VSGPHEDIGIAVALALAGGAAIGFFVGRWRQHRARRNVDALAHDLETATWEAIDARLVVAQKDRALAAKIGDCPKEYLHPVLGAVRLGQEVQHAIMLRAIREGTVPEGLQPELVAFERSKADAPPERVPWPRPRESGPVEASPRLPADPWEEADPFPAEVPPAPKARPEHWNKARLSPIRKRES